MAPALPESCRAEISTRFTCRYLLPLRPISKMPRFGPARPGDDGAWVLRPRMRGFGFAGKVPAEKFQTQSGGQWFDPSRRRRGAGSIKPQAPEDRFSGT